MGQVSGRVEDLPQLYLRDQARFALDSIRISDVNDNEITTISVKTDAGNRISATNENKRPNEFIQDVSSDNPDTVILKLKRTDELVFHFTGRVLGGSGEVKPPLTGLTFIHTSTQKEAKRLLTTDFNADPNLQKHKNVTYVGDYQNSFPFEWTWTWRAPSDSPTSPPNGHRSFCCFVEYSQRENSFSMLAAFSFWVEDFSSTTQTSPQKRVGKLTITTDPFEGRLEPVPESPEITAVTLTGGPDINREYTKSPPLPTHEPIQLSNPRDDELLLKEVEDGPLFRSRIIGLEKRTAALKAKTKKVISRGEALLEAQNAYVEADRRWYDSLQQLASTNSRAVQPLLANYLDASFVQSQAFHRRKVAHLQILINELRRIYDFDIKAAEQKKRAFEEESQDYYHSMTKYLSKNETEPSKQKEKDSKYQSRRKDYELKRFDYWSYMNDLNGGRKEQEILHHLTQYMDSQLNTLTDMTRSERELKPGLDALLQQVEEASREFKLMRTEREQRRRDLEMGKAVTGGESWQPQTEIATNPSQTAASAEPLLVPESTTSDPATPNASGGYISRGQWLSDVEDDDKVDPSKRKKEGILFALSRPANHNDPKVMPKLNWHKYWVVLDKGQLWEYTNWKRSSELHNDSIHLTAATVREAQNSERRFCFELVTPKFKRVYQAMSHEDMESWIQAIRNAIECALDGSATSLDLQPSKLVQNVKRHPIGDMFSGKGGKDRRTVSGSYEPRELLTGASEKSTSTTKSSPSRFTTIRNADPSNSVCADCGSTSKVEWCSINLAVIVCIDCSGVHRSLGSHISKMRSLTLDTASFNPHLVTLLRMLPNAASNAVWEHTPNPSYPKPSAQSPYEARLSYITAKYVEKAFVEPLPASTSPNELLIRSITQSDLKGVLWALARKADPNTRTPVLPAVFIALQQDDKMATLLSKTESGSSNDSAQLATEFPMAELLLLNGANPVDLKTLSAEANGLSDAARRYLQAKVERALQNAQSPPIQHAIPPKNIAGLGITNTSPSQSGSIGGDLNRTVSKLQKRLSAGGKNFRAQLSPPLDKDRENEKRSD